MLPFIIITLSILFILHLIYKSNRTDNEYPYPNYKHTPNIDIDPKQSSIQELLLYKKKGIKNFAMKGMYYRDLNPELHKGDFIGYAKCEDNDSDLFAVAIYNKEGEHLAYTGRGNERLSNSIQKWHKGKLVAWGYLLYDDYYDKWEGTVYMPVGYSEAKTQQFEQLLNLINTNKTLIKEKIKSTSLFFEILKNHTQIKLILNELEHPKELEYAFPKNVIPSISNHLEKEGNWKMLIELEKYTDLISELNEKYQRTTLNRIKKAKELINNSK